MSTTTTNKFQEFLDKHVQRGTALGLQGVVFDKNGIVFTGASGDHTMASADNNGEAAAPAKPMNTDTVHWVASCTKITISVMVMELLDKGVNGLSLKSLDDHEALIKYVPEFDHKNKSNVTQIITGYGDVGADGKRTPILTPSTNKVTLRQLLTHTSGLAYYWNHPLMQEWYRPSDKSEPNGILAFASGRIADFEVPLVREGGVQYDYCPGTDWLGQFIVRVTGKNLRAAFFDLIVEPLGLPTSQIDMRVRQMLKGQDEGKVNRASFYVRLPPPSADEAQSNGSTTTNGHTSAPPPKYLHIPLPQYEPDSDEPPQGMAHFASANIHAPLPVYARILQAVLSHDKRLLSEDAWKEAEQDSTTPRGIKVPTPNMQTYMPDLTYPIEHFLDTTHSDAEEHDKKSGINLLQAHVAVDQTNSGLSPGAYSWAGLANTYWFIDPVKGVGAIFGTQLLPFYDPQMVQARNEWEKLVTSSV